MLFDGAQEAAQTSAPKRRRTNVGHVAVPEKLKKRSGRLANKKKSPGQRAGSRPAVDGEATEEKNEEDVEGEDEDPDEEEEGQSGDEEEEEEEEEEDEERAHSVAASSTTNPSVLGKRLSVGDEARAGAVALARLRWRGVRRPWRAAGSVSSLPWPSPHLPGDPAAGKVL